MTVLGYGPRPLEESRQIHAVQRRRHQSENGERRIAPAHVRRRLDDAAELLRTGKVGERRSGVGDREEVKSGRDLGHRGVIGIRLGGGAGLGRHAEQRASTTSPFAEAADGVGVRRVQDAQLGPLVRRDVEDAAEELRGERRAAHPQHGGAPIAITQDVVAQMRQVSNPIRHGRREVEPAQPGGQRIGRVAGCRP